MGDRLVSEMFGPVMRRSRFSRPSVWEKTNLPKSMRGIWWHSYTTTVSTFLHNRPAQLKHANVWSAKDTPLVCGEGCKGTDQQGISDYKNNRRGGFKYTFHFSKLPGSREYNWAKITPALGSFAMGKDTHLPSAATTMPAATPMLERHPSTQSRPATSHLRRSAPAGVAATRSGADTLNSSAV